MKRYISVLLLLMLVSITNISWAQKASSLDIFYDNLASSAVSMDMKYNILMQGVKVAGSGSLMIQGEMWSMKGNGIEIWCNGKSVWTLDSSSKEVIIDNVSDDYTSGLLANPAILLLKADEMFSLKNTIVSRDGKAKIYILHPKSESDVEYVNLEIRDSDATLLGAEFSLTDGTSAKVEFSMMALTEKKPADYFSQPVRYDASWIVTDMR